MGYTYEAYGRSTADASTSTNSQQYTGRENDNPGNSEGLYYYRNRYFMPGCGRFISEDPIGWASGQANNYAYVGGDPVSYTDPYGLCAETQYSIGIGGSFGGAPVGFGPFVGGGMAVGITSNWMPFIQFQATGSVGLGLFGGVGIQGGISRSQSPTPVGLSVSQAAQGDFNFGTGPSIGGSASINAGEGSRVFKVRCLASVEWA